VIAAEFERDGHVVIRGVIPPAELAAFHDVFMSLVPELPYPPGPDGVIRELTGLARQYEPLLRIACDRRFGALVAQALGAARVQLLQDSLLYKPAREGGSVEWHQDRTYIGYLEPARVATLRIALVPEDEHNGRMLVVDGSHRWGAVGLDRSLTATNVASLVPHLSVDQQAEVARARSLPLAAGDVSIHHCLTLHGSPPNHGAAPRRTILLRMFDATCRLVPAKLPPGAEPYFPTDAHGHLAEAGFPVTYMESGQPP
jgi:ectoine hydroxylase-related dioxygenase (phytanoyl-CoA dioxygenase family)